jgi:hypothetical protein
MSNDLKIKGMNIKILLLILIIKKIMIDIKNNIKIMKINKNFE